jgi:hypothetical protein
MAQDFESFSCYWRKGNKPAVNSKQKAPGLGPGANKNKNFFMLICY